MKKAIVTLLFTASIIASYLYGKASNGNLNPNSQEFFNNYVDMREVIDFEATETGLYLYTQDGSGYYWER